MELIKENNITTLKPNEGYVLKRKDDNYIPKSTDEEGNIVEEYVPYYFETAYVPNNMSIGKLKEIYEEVKLEER